MIMDQILVTVGIMIVFCCCWKIDTTLTDILAEIKKKNDTNSN